MKIFNVEVKSSHLKIFNNAVLVFGYRIFQKLLSFAVIYFVIRALTPEQYGEYNFILTLLSFSTITALPGLQESVTQSTARGFMGVYRKSQPIAFLSSLVGSVALLCVGLWYYFYQQNIALAAGCTLAAFLFSFSYGLEQWKGLRKGLEDFKTIVKMGSFFSSVQSVLIIASVLLVPNSYLLPVFFVLLIPVIKNIFMTYKAHKLVPKGEVVEKESMTYGYKITGYSVFNVVANNIDSLLLFTLLSPTALAIYVVANKLPEIIKALVQDVGAVLAPRFAKHKSYTRETDRYIKVFSLVSGIGIIGFAFTIMPYFMQFVFGDSYSEAILYAQIIMCSLAVGNISILQSRYIYSKLDAKSNRDITIIMSLSRILSSIVLVPIFGIWGAVFSILIYRLVMTITVQYIMRKRYAL